MIISKKIIKSKSFADIFSQNHAIKTSLQNSPKKIRANIL